MKKQTKKQNPEPETKMITIPQAWFEGLLKHAESFDKESKTYEFKKSYINDKIFLNSSTLCGFAMSAKNIIEDNNRIYY